MKARIFRGANRLGIALGLATTLLVTVCSSLRFYPSDIGLTGPETERAEAALHEKVAEWRTRCPRQAALYDRCVARSPAGKEWGCDLAPGWDSPQERADRMEEVGVTGSDDNCAHPTGNISTRPPTPLEKAQQWARSSGWVGILSGTSVWMGSMGIVLVGVWAVRVGKWVIDGFRPRGQ